VAGEAGSEKVQTRLPVPSDNEGAQSVEAVNERKDREIAPDEAGIETDRIRAEQVESFQTGEHPSALSDEHKPLVGERLVEPFETAPDKGGIERIQAERGESFQTRRHSHYLADESAPGATDRPGEQGKQQIEHNKTGVIRPTDEQIARRAYELYSDRGQTPGHDLEDWLKAEWELSENWGQ
jgi:Protein of unknown function (DUF2934)